VRHWRYKTRRNERRAQSIGYVHFKISEYFSQLLYRIKILGYKQELYLTGAVASQRATEARDGKLRLVGNQPATAKAVAFLMAHLSAAN
jgi:4-hydroxyphenylpyruvate dioxygenase-like putative hemolysin